MPCRATLACMKLPDPKVCIVSTLCVIDSKSGAAKKHHRHLWWQAGSMPGLVLPAVGAVNWRVMCIIAEPFHAPIWCRCDSLLTHAGGRGRHDDGHQVEADPSEELQTASQLHSGGWALHRAGNNAEAMSAKRLRFADCILVRAAKTSREPCLGLDVHSAVHFHERGPAVQRTGHSNVVPGVGSRSTWS